MSLREPRESRRSAESSPGPRSKAFACALTAPCIALSRTTLHRHKALYTSAGRMGKALGLAASQSLYRARGLGRPRCCASVQSCARASSALIQVGATRCALWQPAARKDLLRASRARGPRGGPLVLGGACLKPTRFDLQAFMMAQRGAGRAPLTGQTCGARVGPPPCPAPP